MMRHIMYSSLQIFWNVDAGEQSAQTDSGVMGLKAMYAQVMRSMN